MTPRLIQHLVVRPTARQVDAFELALGTYLNLIMAVVVTNWLITEFVRGPMADVAPWLRGIAVVGSVLVLRPWHRHARFDLDTRSLTVDWRLLGLLPVLRREFPLDERCLGVALRSHTKVSTETENPLGCAAVLLPFPLNLIAWLTTPKATTTREHTRTWPALGVANAHGDRVETVMDLAGPAVADGFLDAVREVMPEAVAPEDVEWFVD